jgi:hypothetical protein
MSAARILAELPDDARVSVTIGQGDLRVRDLREAFAGPDPNMVLTTGQAAERLGYSGDWWRRAAKDGDVPGAYQDGDHRGTWRLPIVGCIEHLHALRSPQRTRRRAPWSATEAQQDARTPPVLARSMARGGLASVGRRSSDSSRPAFPRLAE